MGRGQRMGWGRQRSVVILLTDTRREMKGMRKKKLFKVMKTDPFSEVETEYLKPLAMRVNCFTLPTQNCLWGTFSSLSTELQKGESLRVGRGVRCRAWQDKCLGTGSMRTLRTASLAPALTGVRSKQGAGCCWGLGRHSANMGCGLCGCFAAGLTSTRQWGKMLQYLTKEQYVLLFIRKLLYKQEYLFVLSLCLLYECCRVQSRDMLPFTKISLLLLHVLEPQASDSAALSHKHGTDVYH